jgi:hypothetical protein
MKTEKSNKLIADFMGLQFSKGEYYRPLYNSGDWISVNQLKYHTSWDWLMPVIKECLKGEAEVNEDVSNTIVINIYEGLCSQDKSLTYKSVVKFIKEYNDN